MKERIRDYARGIGKSILGIAAAAYTAVAGANYAQAQDNNVKNYPYSTTGEAEVKGTKEETRYGARVLSPVMDKLFIGGEYSTGTRNDGEADLGVGQRIRFGDKNVRLGWNAYVVQRDNEGVGEVALSPGLELLSKLADFKTDLYYSMINRENIEERRNMSLTDPEIREIIDDYIGGRARLTVPLLTSENGASLNVIGELYAFMLNGAETPNISGAKAGARLRFPMGEKGKYGVLQFRLLYDNNPLSTPGNFEGTAGFVYPFNIDFRSVEKDLPYLNLGKPEKPKPPVEPKKPKPSRRKEKPRDDDDDDECEGGDETN